LILNIRVYFYGATDLQNLAPHNLILQAAINNINFEKNMKTCRSLMGGRF